MGVSNSKQTKEEEIGGEAGDLEPSPSGMLVQRRISEAGSTAGSFIRVRISNGSSQLELSLPSYSTFGDLKQLIYQTVGLEPQDQRLLFKGKEKENNEQFNIVGVKNMSKVVLMVDPTNREKKLEELRRNEDICKACNAISLVRADVKKLSEKVSALKAFVHRGKKVEEKELIGLTELLMLQLLKLDGIKAEGEAKVQRKVEVNLIQSYVETLDALRARNSCLLSTLPS